MWFVYVMKQKYVGELCYETKVCMWMCLIRVCLDN